MGPAGRAADVAPRRIRYVAGGSAHTATLRIDGCGRMLSQGERFTLFVDPSNYHRFVTADSGNESPAAFLAGLALLLPGLFFSVAGGLRCWRLCQMRQVLRTAGWAQQHAWIVTVPRDGWGGGGKVVIRQTETEPTVLKLPLSPGGHRALPDDTYTDIDLVLARGESGHWAVARDERSHPVPAKELRDGRLYDQALAIVAR
jgi:hypothetical protein